MKRMTCAKGFFAQARAIASEGEEKPDRLWRLFVGLVDQGRAQGETSNAADGASHSLKILHMYGQRNRDFLSTSLEIYRNQCTGCIGRFSLCSSLVYQPHEKTPEPVRFLFSFRR